MKVAVGYKQRAPDGGLTEEDEHYILSRDHPLDLVFQPRFDFILRFFKLVLSLQPQPHFGTRTQSKGKPDSGVAGYSPLAAYDIIYPVGRHINAPGKGALGKPQGVQDCKAVVTEAEGAQLRKSIYPDRTAIRELVL